ncbi:MAG: hypothetical protein ACO34E_04100 [Limisphaerales bacterium]
MAWVEYLGRLGAESRYDFQIKHDSWCGARWFVFGRLRASHWSRGSGVLAGLWRAEGGRAAGSRFGWDCGGGCDFNAACFEGLGCAGLVAGVVSGIGSLVEGRRAAEGEDSEEEGDEQEAKAGPERVTSMVCGWALR